ncbi:MAG: polyprenyl synthetase family protein [Candidatus Aenigmatarchaeota archaeon]
MIKKNNQKLVETALEIFKRRGEKALDVAKKTILQEKIEYKPIYDALRYFSQEIWLDFKHPALLSLACEAVGGNPEIVLDIGAAIAMLSGAADIHDDIIDKSETKASKLTVYGKFGYDIALLVGDALLFEGLLLLHEACGKLQKAQAKKILELVKNAFIEIGVAEVKETVLRRKLDLNPTDYLDVIMRRASVAEVCMRIGAVLGGGSTKEVNVLGHYGRTLGILMTIRDEFVDIFEPNELKHRVENECLPLPLLYAFQTPKVRDRIIKILKKETIGENDVYKIISLIMKTKGVQRMKRKMCLLVKNEIKNLSLIKNNTAVMEELITILKAGLEDL